MNRATRYVTLAAAIGCFVAPLFADEKPGPLDRIEALTTEQSTDLLIQFLRDRAERCRVEIGFSEQEAFLTAFLGSVLSSLDIPEARHAKLYPVLEDKLDSLDDGGDNFDAKMDANFEVVAEDDERMVLVVRDCEVFGS